MGRPRAQGVAVALVCVLMCLKQSFGADPRLRIHLVPHSHDDAGWLKTFDEYYYGARQDIQIAGVREVLSSVVTALQQDSRRTFAWGDMSFFIRWWADQGDSTRAAVRQLVKEGRLEFVNGGIVQHDEAGAHYVAMIDQTTRGHRFLKREFGIVPRVGWQVDPFGHSSTHASLMSALVGFEALFFGRADYQDMARRKEEKALEMIWRGSGSWGAASDIFTHNYYTGNYGPPQGFNYEWALSTDPPVVDDPDSPSFNAPARAEAFIAAAREWAAAFRGPIAPAADARSNGGQTRNGARSNVGQTDAAAVQDVLFMMGTDFTYANAHVWYKNMEALIKQTNLTGGAVQVVYSTPSAYAAARRAAYPGPWPLKTDDLFPYADCPHCYWTGYFSSRPTSKAFIRASTSFLQAARQLAVLSQLPMGPGFGTDRLEWAVSIAQHHDAITGTAKQAVANDYHRMLSRGWEDAARAVTASLSRLLLQPEIGSSFDSGGGSSGGGSSGSTVGSGGGGSSGGSAEGRGEKRGQWLWQGPAAARRLLAWGRRDSSSSRSSSGGSGLLHVVRQQPQPPPPHPSQPEDLQLTLCPLLNASACPATVGLPLPSGGFLVVVYNPLAFHRVGSVRIPVPEVEEGSDWLVQDSTGAATDSQLIPAFPATLRLQQAMADAGEDPSSFAKQDLVFAVGLPPLGYETYLVAPTPTPSANEAASTPASKKAGTAAAAAAPAVASASAEPSAADSGPTDTASSSSSDSNDSSSNDSNSSSSNNDGDIDSLENRFIRVEFDRSTGRLRAVTAADGSWRVGLTQEFLFYPSSTGDEGDGTTSGSPEGVSSPNSAGSPESGSSRAKPPADSCTKAQPSPWELHAGRYTAAVAAATAAAAADAVKSGAGHDQTATTKTATAVAAADGEDEEEGNNGPLGQPSGAYIFRPSGLVRTVAEDWEAPIELSVVKGPVVQELRQCWVEWACLTTRLGRGDSHLEQEWTVGPLPDPTPDTAGYEVVLRTVTDLDTGGVFFTDANGREMLRRVRGTRPSWPVQLAEPVAGNYYPITSGAALMGPQHAQREQHSTHSTTAGNGSGGRSADGSSAGGGKGGWSDAAGDVFAVTLATDRAQGAASLEDGQLEVMLHRSTSVDDMRGVGEPLRETMCGCRAPCGCPGLIARGTFRLSAGPVATAAAAAAAAAAGSDATSAAATAAGNSVTSGAARAARMHQLLLNDPPVIAIARLEQQAQPHPTPASSAEGSGGEETAAAEDKRKTGHPLSGRGAAERAAAARAAAAQALRARIRGRWSGLAGGGAPLPEGVHLVTLMRANESEAGGPSIVRLAHMFQVGEAEQLSKPIEVDLSSMFDRPVASVTELSLTAALRRDEMRPRLPAWDVEPLTAGGVQSGGGSGGSGDDGETAALGALRWGDAGARRLQQQIGHKQQQQQEHQQQQQREEVKEVKEEEETFDVWDHSGEQLPVVRLYPMELRTFEITWAD